MPGLWKEPYKTKKGTKYRVRQRDDEGKTKDLKPKFFHANPANKYIETVADASAEGKPIQDAVKVSECLVLYLIDRKKLVHTPEKRNIIEPSTYRINEDSLEPFKAKFGEKLIAEIKSEDLETFKNELLTEKKPAGINYTIRNFRQFFNYCVKTGLLKKDNPAKGIKEFDPKKIKEWRVLNRRELAHFMKLCRGERLWLRRAIYVLYNTGFRSGEFVRMKWDDLEANGINTTNKGKTRFVPVTNKTVRRLILKFIKNPIKISTLHSAWRDIVAAAKMGRVRPHDMRHTWASNLVQAGWPRKAIMDMGGWSSSEMLDIYTHFEREFLVEKMRTFRIRKAC